jgi:hypothetical protein
VWPELVGDVSTGQLSLSQGLGFSRLRARPGHDKGLAPTYHPRSLDNREGGSQASLIGWGQRDLAGLGRPWEI